MITEGAKHLGDERDVEITSPVNGESWRSFWRRDRDCRVSFGNSDSLG